MVRPLRRRTPYLGPVPGFVPLPARRPRAALLVVAAAVALPIPAHRVVLTRPPSRPTVPHTNPAPRVLLPVPPGRRGTVFLSRVPDRTVRLSSVQLTARVARRDERRGPGAALFVSPHRASPRLSPEQTTALVVLQPSVAPPRGSVILGKPPARTVRLSAFQSTARVVWRDERRGTGIVLFVSPHRASPRLIPGQTRPLVRLQPPVASPRGMVILGKPPARTVRLSAFQSAARVVQRDERRFTGRVWVGSPSRTGTLVVIPRVPRPLLAGRDQRGTTGQVFRSFVPARTQRLPATQTTVRLVRRDERSFAGRVFIGSPSRTGMLVVIPRVPRLLVVARDQRATAGSVFRVQVPARTQRLTVAQTAGRVIRRDERGFAGRVFISSPRRTGLAGITPRLPRLLVAARDERRGSGRILIAGPRPGAVSAAAVSSRAPLVVTRRLTSLLPGTVGQIGPPRPTIRLLAVQTVIRITTRQSFPYRGGVLQVRPALPRSVPRLPHLLLATRDERRFAGSVWNGLSGRMNAVAVLHGNSRAKVTLRPGPGTTLTLRPGPSATLVLTEG